MSGTAEAGFDYLLDRLPFSKFRMASDAATSFGMAGVLRFAKSSDVHPHFDGFFWQIQWDQWYKITSARGILPQHVTINTAEYLALLITCETFADQCEGCLTYLDIDNTAAQRWFEAARCPIFPFDRCGQGTHLYMLERNMKVKTNWVCSAANTLADTCSRQAFSMRKAGHVIDGFRLRGIKPRWQSVVKFV